LRRKAQLLPLPCEASAYTLARQPIVGLPDEAGYVESAAPDFWALKLWSAATHPTAESSKSGKNMRK
jgi:hypothetical protein